jgi:outer membrane assembly lipoprotein YfiO
MYRHVGMDQGGWGRQMLAVACLSVTAWAGQAWGQQRHELDGGQWVQQETHAPDSPEGQLDAIRKLIAQGEGENAKYAADDWIERHPGHPLLSEAYLIRGDANVTRNHLFKSLFDYEKVIREFPGSEQFHTAMQREFELAKLFVAGTKRRLWGMRILPATDEAEEIFIRIQERSPGSDLGEMASIALADFYFNKPQMESASEAYDLFLVNYPRSEQREWAMLRLIQANLARFKGPNFDATGLIDAGQRLKTYRLEYPASSQRIGVEGLLIRIDESLAMRDISAAQWHEKRYQPLSAIYLYRRVVQDYPQTAAALDAVRRLEEMGVEVVAIQAQAVLPDEPRRAEAPVVPLVTEVNNQNEAHEAATEEAPAPSVAPATMPASEPATQPVPSHTSPQAPSTQPDSSATQPQPPSTQPEKP